MTSAPEFRPDLTDIAAYRAGRRAKGKPGDVYSLASNETTFGPLPGVMHAAGERVAESHRYPDPGVTELSKALANHLGVEPDWISTGTGSVALCQQAVVATCSPGDEVLHAWRSFEAYPIITKLAGAIGRPIPLLRDGRHDLNAMVESVSDRTRVIFLCSPNNPTGPALSTREVEGFLAQIPTGILVVLDEAYFEFATQSEGSSELANGVAIARSHSNVLALRTFSKAFGLAGLRVGYGISQPPIAAALGKAALPFGVSSAAQAAALASLRGHSEMQERVRAVIGERTRIVEAARATGWSIPDTAANFYWIPLGPQTLDFSEACLAVGVTVRAFPDEGVRVTIGEHEANDRVLAVLQGSFSK